MRAHASTPLHEQDAAEQVRLDAELVEAAHVATHVDAVKFNGVHGQILGRASLPCAKILGTHVMGCFAKPLPFAISLCVQWPRQVATSPILLAGS